MELSAATNEVLAKIIEYRNRAHVTRRAHYLASTRNQDKNIWFGVPVVVLTSIVGTAIFATLQENPSTSIKIATGMMSIGAAVLAALQTYLGYSEKSAKHKEAGAGYAAVWRSLDMLHLKLNQGGDAFAPEAINQLAAIVDKLNEIGRDSPSVPDNDYNVARKELREQLFEKATAQAQTSKLPV